MNVSTLRLLDAARAGRFLRRGGLRTETHARIFAFALGAGALCGCNDSESAARGSATDPGAPRAEEVAEIRDQYVLDGRVGQLDAQGTLRVTSKSLPDHTFQVATNVQDFQLLDWRVGVLRRDGTLWVGDGPLSERLTLVAPRVAAYQVAAARVGILSADGTFSVAEGGLVPKQIASGIRAFHITPDRIGLLGNDGTFWVQDGMAHESFRRVSGLVERFQLDREWIAYTEARGDRRLMLGRGQLAGMQFVEQGRNVADFEMEVWSDPNEHDETRVRLSHVDATGKVVAGNGHLEPQLENREVLNRFSLQRMSSSAGVKEVHWANGRLLTVDRADRVRVSSPFDGAGNVNDVVEAGSVQDLSWGGANVVVRSEAALAAKTSALSATLREGEQPGLPSSEESTLASRLLLRAPARSLRVGPPCSRNPTKPDSPGPTFADGIPTIAGIGVAK